jgi:lipooligosaccharide transport system permease protein
MATPPVMRVVEREARVFRRLWRGVGFSMFAQPVLYLAAMGLGLGGLVDDHTGAVQGLDYLDFVAPGLLVASAMQLAASEGMWPVLGGVKWMRHYFGVIATPITPGELFSGYVLWVALRSLLGALAFLLGATVLGAVPSAWGVLAAPAAALTAGAFCALIAAFSITQETDLAFPMIMRLGVLPLFLFSGTFFPIEQLPDGLQPLAYVSPLWHGVELARSATTNSFAAADLGHLAVLVGCITLGLAIGTRTATRRLTA